MNYTTNDIAKLIGVNTAKVNYYIRCGYLIANKGIDNKYTITREDYISFYDNYFNTDKRNSNRGISKKITDYTIKIWLKILRDAKDKCISYEKFMDIYKADFNNIPNFNEIAKYKRDISIRVEKEDACRYTIKQLAHKYGLSEITVKGILNQEKGDNLFNF